MYWFFIDILFIIIIIYVTYTIHILHTGYSSSFDDNYRYNQQMYGRGALTYLTTFVLSIDITYQQCVEIIQFK